MSVWRRWATHNDIHYPPLRGNGWKQQDPTTLLVVNDWDSDRNITQVRTTVALIKKGCGCKTGCLLAHCKCKKGGNLWGPGCKCLRLCNLPANPSQDIEVDEAEDCDSDSDSDGDFEQQVDNIMIDIFGGYDSSAEQSSRETDRLCHQ